MTEYSPEKATKYDGWMDGGMDLMDGWMKTDE